MFAILAIGSCHKQQDVKISERHINTPQHSDCLGRLRNCQRRETAGVKLLKREAALLRISAAARFRGKCCSLTSCLRTSSTRQLLSQPFVLMSKHQPEGTGSERKLKMCQIKAAGCRRNKELDSRVSLASLRRPAAAPIGKVAFRNMP